jgi:hypothetical protein
MAMIALPENPEEQMSEFRENMRPRPLDRADYPGDFDPTSASDERLAQFGFPPRPDAESEPELRAFWTELFTPPFQFQQQDLRSDLAFALPDSYASAGRATSPSRREASLNWSGAYITPRDGRMFTRVVGSFRVPHVSLPNLPGVAEARSSTWIGLDGARSYLNSTLPQIGSAQHVTAAAPNNPIVEAWIQWWPRPAFTLLNFTIKADDRLMCWLSVIDPTHVLVALRNMNTHDVRMFEMLAPRVVDPPRFPKPIQVHVSGATAEWITERPAHRGSPVLYELPDYDEVVFEQCYAGTTRGHSPRPRVEKLVGPKLVRMYRRAKDPQRTVTISVARRLDDDRAKTSYRG